MGARGAEASAPAWSGLLPEDGMQAARAIRKARGVKDPAVAVLLAAAMSHTDSYVRKTAVEAARPFDSPDIVRAKIGCLSDEEANVRESAVAALENHDGPEVEEALLLALADPFWTVRKGALEALRSHNAARVTAAFKRAASGDEDGEVRRKALAVLWERIGHDDDERLEWGRRGLRDRDTSVRLEALRLVAELPDPQALVLLSPLLEDGSAMIRTTAARALELRPNPTTA